MLVLCLLSQWTDPILVAGFLSQGLHSVSEDTAAPPPPPPPHPLRAIMSSVCEHMHDAGASITRQPAHEHGSHFGSWEINLVA